MADTSALVRPVAPAAGPPRAPETATATSTALVTTTGRRRKPRKSNSERGKEFRAKRKDYEVSLLEMIQSLRDEVRDLSVLRAIRGETALVTRLGPDGSVARLIREYFTLFARGRPVRLHAGGKRGTPSAVDELLTKQESFLESAMGGTLQFGSIIGVDALIDQWERYSTYHANFRVSITSIEVSGSEESPLVTVTPNLCVTLTRDTFHHIFPHVANNEALVQRLVGKTITYRGVNQFHFGADDHRVLVYESDVDFVNPFLTAGVSLADVALLMGQALITDQYLLGEDPLSPPPSKPSSPSSDADMPSDTEAPSISKRPCQTIEFLLN